MRVLYRIKIMTLMQLGDKFSLSKITNKKRFAVNILLKILLMSLITLVVTLLLGFVKQYASIPIDYRLVLFVLAITQILSIISCALGLMTTLYNSPDNTLLLSYPVRHNEVFISKLLIYYIFEFVKNLSFLIPFLLGVGLVNGFGFVYFINVLFMVITLPLLSVLIGALISLPTMYIVNFIKNKPFILLGLITLVVFALTYFLVGIVKQLPEEFRLLAFYGQLIAGLFAFMDKFNKFTLMYANYAKIIYNITPTINWLIVGAVIIGLVIVVALVTMPTYFYLASKGVETSNKRHKSNNKPSKNVFFAVFKKELKTFLRNSDKLINHFLFLLLLPFVMYLCDSILATMKVNFIGQVITVGVNVMLGLLFLLSGNTASATGLTTEGNEFYLIKTSPIDVRMVAWAKVAVNAIFSILSITATTIILTQMKNIIFREAIFMGCIFVCLTIGHALWSFELDLLNPKLHEYASNNSLENNANVAKSISIGAIVSIIFGGLTMFFYWDNANGVWIRMILIAVAFLVARIYLFSGKLKVFFRDVEL